MTDLNYNILETKVDDLERTVENYTDKVNNLNYLQNTNKSELSMTDNVLKEEDEKLHQEIHDLSVTVDTNESRISDLELQIEMFPDVYDKISGLTKELDATNKDLHSEIHILASKLNDIGIKVDEVSIVNKINEILEKLLGV